MAYSALMGVFLCFLMVLSLWAVVRSDNTCSFDVDASNTLKAVMPLFIVLGHLSYVVDVAWIQPIKYLGAPIVSVFFFISGYGLARSYEFRGSQYLRRFFKRRVLPLAVPFFITVVLYYLAVKIPNSDYHLHLIDQLRSGVLEQHQLWYVYILMIDYLVYFVAYRYAKGAVVRLIIVFMCSVLIVAVCRTLGYDRCWWVESLAFPTGICYTVCEDRLKTKLSRNLYAVVYLGILGLLSVLCYSLHNEVLYCGVYVFIPCAVAFVVARLPRLTGRGARFLSKISYEIYLCHIIVIRFLRSQCLSVESDEYYIALTIVFTILLAWLINTTKRLCLGSLSDYGKTVTNQSCHKA